MQTPTSSIRIAVLFTLHPTHVSNLLLGLTWSQAGEIVTELASNKRSLGQVYDLSSSMRAGNNLAAKANAEAAEAAAVEAAETEFMYEFWNGFYDYVDARRDA